MFTVTRGMNHHQCNCCGKTSYGEETVKIEYNRMFIVLCLECGKDLREQMKHIPLGVF